MTANTGFETSESERVFLWELRKWIPDGDEDSLMYADVLEVVEGLKGLQTPSEDDPLLFNEEVKLIGDLRTLKRQSRRSQAQAAAANAHVLDSGPIHASVAVNGQSYRFDFSTRSAVLDFARVGLEIKNRLGNGLWPSNHDLNPPCSAQCMASMARDQSAADSPSTNAPSDPATSIIRAPRAPSPSLPSESYLSAEGHLKDYFHLASQPPDIEEFGYKFDVSTIWDELEKHKKDNLVHARLILGRYGESIGTPCESCRQAGFTCRRYSADFQPVTGFDIGSACQNCRVWTRMCDYGAESQSLPVTTGTSTSLSRSLPQDSGVEESITPMRPRPYSPRRSTSGPKVALVAKAVGVHMTGIEDVQAMYDSWLSSHSLPGFRYTSNRVLYKNLKQFYEDLVDLAIVAEHTNDDTLSYRIVSLWQETTCRYSGRLPDENLSIVIKAHEFLKAQSPLLGWLQMFHSFIWDSTDYGTYQNFCERANVKPDPTAAFLYVVAQIRDPFTKGADFHVLKHWCSYGDLVFHNHALGDHCKEQIMCLQTRDRIAEGLYDQSAKEFRKQQLDEARAIIKEEGDRSDSLLHSSFLPLSSKRELPVSPLRGPLAKRHRGRDGSSLGNRTHSSTTSDEELQTPPAASTSDNEYIPSKRTLALMNRWFAKKTLKPPYGHEKIVKREKSIFGEHKVDPLDRICEDLLDLFIHVNHKLRHSHTIVQHVRDQLKVMERAILKQWQLTAHSPKHGRSPVDLDLVVKAFEKLPPDHFFLEYLTTWYGYEWKASEEVPHPEYVPVGPAKERFLHGVVRQHSYILQKLMPQSGISSGDRPLLWDWCRFHEHKSEEEQKACERERDELVGLGWEKQWEFDWKIARDE